MENYKKTRVPQNYANTTSTYCIPVAIKSALQLYVGVLHSLAKHCIAVLHVDKAWLAIIQFSGTFSVPLIEWL